MSYNFSNSSSLQKDIIIKKKETVTMTFRIDKDVFNKLHLESESHGISFNSLLNSILKDYVEWNIFQPQAGMIPVVKPVLVAVFAKMSKDEIIDLAKRIAKDAIKDVCLFMTGKGDLDSFLSWIELRVKKCGAEICYGTKNLDNNQSSSNDDDYALIIKHDLGENWSLYNKILLESIFNQAFEKRVHIQISSTIIALKLER